LTLQQQRFCPLCDRAFLEGEAVLRCEGCGIMHHPGCWVTNGGCATRNAHASTPLAQAYSTGRPAGAEAPHPGEGMRVTAPGRGAYRSDPQPAPARGIYPTDPVRAPRQEEAPEPQFDAPGRRPVLGVDDEGWPVIGGAGAPPAAHRARAEYLAGQPLGAPAGTQVPQRRYVPPPYEVGPRPLPRVYGRHPLLGYWYVPVGLLFAAAVAFGVIWVVGMFTGGSTPAATPTVGPTVAALGAASGTTPVPAGATTAPGATGTGSPAATTGPGSFTAGEVLVVSGTAPDCLNVRTGPAIGNPAIVCLKDGETVTVTGGPTAAGGLTWWEVKTSLGEGWAAEDYLAKQ
jgi:hypothetical protein